MSKYDIKYFLPDFPKDSFNLINGGAGAGKTTWMLPKLIDLYNSGTEILYTCCDRTLLDAKRTLINMGYPHDALPMMSFHNEDQAFSFEGLKILIKAHQFMHRDRPPLELVYVEAIIYLEEKIISPRDVAMFGRKVNKFMEETGIAIWGTSWASKSSDDFKRVRDKIGGTGAWGGICGTVVNIDFAEDDHSSRIVTICPRWGAERTETWRFEGPRLVKFEKLTPESLLVKGGTITRADLEATGMEDRAISRWAKRMMQVGRLEYVRKGVYVVKS